MAHTSKKIQEISEGILLGAVLMNKECIEDLASDAVQDMVCCEGVLKELAEPGAIEYLIFKMRQELELKVNEVRNG